MLSNPILSLFLGWNELHGGSIWRNSSSEIDQNGDADRLSRVLQLAHKATHKNNNQRFPFPSGRIFTVIYGLGGWPSRCDRLDIHATGLPPYCRKNGVIMLFYGINIAEIAKHTYHAAWQIKR